MMNIGIEARRIGAATRSIRELIPILGVALGKAVI